MRSTRAPRLLTVILAGILITDAAGAQGGSLAGRVLSDSSSLPLAGVEILLTATERSVRTDAQGAFRITGLRNGRHPVLVRMPGFVAVADTVTITDGTELTKDYKLTATTAVLDSVRVTATGGRLSARMRTFERRRAEGFGRFITSDELRKNEDRSLRALLTRLGGLRFAIYESATFAGMARGTLTAPGAAGCRSTSMQSGSTLLSPRYPHQTSSIIGSATWKQSSSTRVSQRRQRNSAAPTHPAAPSCCGLARSEPAHDVRGMKPWLFLALALITQQSCRQTTEPAVEISVTLESSHVMATAGDTVTFTVRANGNNLVGVVIDFGDSVVEQYATGGANTARVTFKHAYVATGNYTVRAVITDAISGDKEVTVLVAVI